MKYKYVILQLIFFICGSIGAQSLNSPQNYIERSTDLYNDDKMDSAFLILDAGMKKFPKVEDLSVQFFYLLDKFREEAYFDSSSWQTADSFFVNLKPIVDRHLKDTTILQLEKSVAGDVIEKCLMAKKNDAAVNELNNYLSRNRGGTKLRSQWETFSVLLDRVAEDDVNSGKLMDLFFIYYRTLFPEKKEDPAIFYECIKWYKTNYSSTQRYFLLSVGKEFDLLKNVPDALEEEIRQKFLLDKHFDTASISSVLDITQFCKKHPTNIFLNDQKTVMYIVLLKELITEDKLSTASWIFRIGGYEMLNDKNILDLRKQWYMKEYKEGFTDTRVIVDELNWTGSFSTCTPGTISASVDEKVLKRVNFFRAVDWLKDSCVLDKVFSEKAMAAALIMGANNMLDHNPNKKYKCYSDLGMEGASNSNLGIGANSAASVTGQMEDDGKENFSVGHRINILSTTLKRIGHGSTPVSCALYIRDGNNYPIKTEEPFYAWPPPGIISMDLFFKRWSLYIEGVVSYEKAKVSITLDGNELPVTIESNDNRSNTLVWQIPFFISTGNATIFKVKISDIYKGGSNVPTEIEYSVEVIH